MNTPQPAPPGLEPPVLELRGVSAGYGRIEVIHEVDLVVPAGSVVALLGPNGAGKTTTLSAIAGTIPLMSGDLLLDGRSIRGLSTYERTRRGIVLVPEGRSVFPSLSVQDNLELVVRAATGDPGERARRLAEVWEIFPRLAERRGQRAGTLSGGEQQMLALSRAFLSSARVLLMDEISMGLAPVLVESLFDAVQKLRDRGRTIVLVEQFLTYALRLADICYVLGRGRVRFLGDAGEMRDGAGADYLQMSDTVAAH
ncbi:MAG: branched-chain amino acid transport system ATP-binding protein [Frankiaceae bacterium]|nr:branched-chain amino acid transport system ATP-binding protein [Frankiaceae bacterium]